MLSDAGQEFVHNRESIWPHCRSTLWVPSVMNDVENASRAMLDDLFSLPRCAGYCCTCQQCICIHRLTSIACRLIVAITPPLQARKWKQVFNPKGTPQQMNGFDCGIFCMMCCNYAAADKEFDYDQSDVHSFFRAMCGIECAITRLRVLDD